ncbi:hypothetical protein ACHAXT_011185 [Thalassiosira profunda]
MAENNNNDDSSVDSDFSGPYEPLDLNEEELRMLKENSKYVDSLYVTLSGHGNRNYGFDELSVDWESDGSAISDNTHLHWLEIRDYIDQTDLEGVAARDLRARIRNAKAFYRAVALNRSIRYLTVEGNVNRGVAMEDVVSILTPCLRESPKLRCFVVGDFDLSARTSQLLASAIYNCTATLSTFGLKRVNSITATSMSKILDAVKKSNISSLVLDENTISDEVATVLGNALPTLCNVNSVSFRGDYEMEHGRITAEGVEAISDGLNNSSVESLNFWRNEIGTTGGIVLAETLSTNTVLKRLDLTMALSTGYSEYIFSEVGWKMFFDFLQSSALIDLSLGCNNIGDANVAPLVEFLNSSSLESLDLWGVRDVSASGWARFFDGLRGNTSLTTLKMHSVGSNLKDELIRSALCDEATIESVCNSNHTLAVLKGRYAFARSDGQRLLEMNEDTDKAKVARRKILEFYFRNGDENLQELVTMEMNLMPQVLECVGRDGIKVSYQLVRSMPSLFSTNALGGKRKRGFFSWRA